MNHVIISYILIIKVASYTHTETMYSALLVSYIHTYPNALDHLMKYTEHTNSYSYHATGEFST